MKIFENYNSAKQKYGVDLVDSLTKLGLPPLYLLSACRLCKPCLHCPLSATH